MSTVVIVALAAVGLFAVLLGGLFAVVWLAGERTRREHDRLEHTAPGAGQHSGQGQIRGAA